MKKIISVFFVMLLAVTSFCSCDSELTNITDDNNETHLPVIEQEEDYYDYYSHVCDSNIDFLETDDGYYYLNLRNSLVYYSEKGKTDFVILCNKPDCSHNDENCNAYAGSHIGYYNGKIYYVSRSDTSRLYELYKMNTDGTNHEKVADMPVAKRANGAGGGASGGFVYFYKGYIINFINLTVDKTTAYPVAYKVELKTGKSTLLFDDELADCASMVTNFYPCNNVIWFEVGYRQTGERLYYCANLDTCEIVYKIKDEDMSNISAREGLLYYYKKNTGFCEYNLLTEEEKILKQYDYTMAEVIYGEEYIVAKAFKVKDDGKDYDSWMVIFDKSYDIIAQVELPTDSETNMAFISVTSDFIFLFEGNEAPKGISHYIDLNKITDGKMTVEKIQ